MRQGIVGLAVVAALSAATIASANSVRMFDAPGGYNGEYDQGGAFRVQWESGFNGLTGGNGQAGNSFLTFCIERNEEIAFNTVYGTQISTSALNGGVGGPSPDPICEQTAWLYRQFRDENSIGGLTINGTDNGGYTAAQLSTALQLAIWRFEEELDSIFSNGNGLYIGSAAARAAAQTLYDAAISATAGRSGDFYGVRVLRLFSGDINRQDQLTLIPLPPAAWAGLSTLAGVGLVGFIRRRKITAQ